MPIQLVVLYLCIIKNENAMKKFDFRRKLKELDLTSLKELKDYHLDLMLGFMGYNEKEADKHFRYLGYIDNKIKKLELANK